MYDEVTNSVGVVVPYFRNPDAWRRSKRALDAQGVDQELIFVRDNSEDNVLYTAAINEGLTRFALQDRLPFVMALTQDAVLHAGALRSMVNVMQENPTVGIVAPVSLDRSGRVRWCGGSDALPWGRHFTTSRDRLPNAPYTTLWANGACLLIRSRLVTDIGLMDDSMRFVFSDIDYSFRARQHGWEVVVCPFAFVEHELAGSSSAAPPWLQIIKLQDQIRFAEKWAFGEDYPRLAREAQRMSADRARELCLKARAQIDALLQSGAMDPPGSPVT